MEKRQYAMSVIRGRGDGAGGGDAAGGSAARPIRRPVVWSIIRTRNPPTVPSRLGWKVTR
jgi:hypothetical protein